MNRENSRSKATKHRHNKKRKRIRETLLDKCDSVLSRANEVNLPYPPDSFTIEELEKAIQEIRGLE